MMNSRIFYALIASFLLFSIELIAQNGIHISGQVLDANTKEPLPFVSVYFKNTKIGTDTGLDGRYDLTVFPPSDTLETSYLGYRNDFTWIDTNKDSLVVDFLLFEEINTSKSAHIVKVKPICGIGRNPVICILDSLVSQKHYSSLSNDTLIVADSIVVNPIKLIGKANYRYYIMDTIDIKNTSNIEIAFITKRGIKHALFQGDY